MNKWLKRIRGALGVLTQEEQVELLGK